MSRSERTSSVMVWVIVAAVGALVAVLGAAAVLRRLSSARLGDPVSAGWALGSVERRGTGATSDVGDDRALRLVSEVRAQETPVAALACIDEFVREVRAELETQRPLPRVYARISLATGTTAASLAVAEALCRFPVESAPALMAFGIGAAGAIIAAHFGRKASERVRAISADYDRLFGRLEQLVAASHPAAGALPPIGPRGRGGRRHAG